MSRYRCDRGANQRKNREDHQRLSQTQTVDDESADDHGENVGKAIHHLQKPQVQVRESKLLLVYIGQRAQSVVGIVASKHRQADKDEDEPAIKRAWLRTKGFGHLRSFPSRLDSG